MAAALVKGADAGSIDGLMCPVGGADVMGKVILSTLKNQNNLVCFDYFELHPLMNVYTILFLDSSTVLLLASIFYVVDYTLLKVTFLYHLLITLNLSLDYLFSLCRYTKTTVLNQLTLYILLLISIN